MSKKKQPNKTTLKALEESEQISKKNKDRGLSWQEEIRNNHINIGPQQVIDKLIDNNTLFLDESNQLHYKGSFAQYVTEVEVTKLDYLPEEFGDVLDVIENGAIKHGQDSWLEPGVFSFGKRSQSEFRHLMKKTGLAFQATMTFEPVLRAAIDLIETRLGQQRYLKIHERDDESGLSHDLHSACNALMFYVVKKRGILKDGDK